jgi:hypothetical protein
MLLPLAILCAVAGALALRRTRGPGAARGAIQGTRRAALPLAVAMALIAPALLLHGEALPFKTTRPVGLAAAAALRTADRLVEYRDLAAGLPLYTDRLPLLAGIDVDTRFEASDTPARTMDAERFLRELWAGPDRVLVVTRPGHADDLAGARELARGGGYVLVSNR